MIVLDTTILVYAAGRDHPLVGPCRELVDAVGAGDVRATTTVEVLQEFAHVRSRRRSRSDAAELTRHFATLLGPALALQDADLESGLELYTLHDRLGAFDARPRGRGDARRERSRLRRPRLRRGGRTAAPRPGDARIRRRGTTVLSGSSGSRDVAADGPTSRHLDGTRSRRPVRPTGNTPVPVAVRVVCLQGPIPGANVET